MNADIQYRNNKATRSRRICVKAAILCCSCYRDVAPSVFVLASHLIARRGRHRETDSLARNLKMSPFLSILSDPVSTNWLLLHYLSQQAEFPPQINESPPAIICSFHIKNRGQNKRCKAPLPLNYSLFRPIHYPEFTVESCWNRSQMTRLSALSFLS